MPFLTENFGNPSSIHHFGQDARNAVDKARHQLAAALNARPKEIVFTSGGTESDNLAIKGLLGAKASVGKGHIVTSAIEHPAVLNVCEHLEKQGYEITYLPVHEEGIVRLSELSAAIREDTLLISVMAANNEIGTLQPIAEIGHLVRDLRNAGRKIWFHTDAVQAFGKVPLDVEEIGCDLLSVSGHKINAPKGIGALYIRRGVRLQSQNIGGHQENEKRGGTEAVPNIVGFGAAAEIAGQELQETAERSKRLRDRIEDETAEKIADIVFNGDREHRVPNIANISFRSIEGEALLIHLDMQGIAVSTGSACSSGTLEPSPVIRALGRDDSFARSAIRFSLGKQNTEADIDRLMDVLPSSVAALRRLAP